MSFALTALPLPGCAQAPPAPEVIAYVFPNQPEGRLLTATEIDATQLTRINYAFALIKNGRMVTGEPNDAANLALLASMRSSQPQLKVVISVGGWLGSGSFSDAALTPTSRKQFVDSAVAFLSRYALDGLDIDWEYPGLPGAGNPFRPEDGANFTLLLKELRTRFDVETLHTHKPLLLTIAAGASTQYLQHTQMAEAQRYLDQVNVMAYDFYEASNNGPSPTGNHAPLFADPADPQKASAAAIIAAFQQAGVPARKLVLGVPFYGHAWGNVPPTNHGLFQPGSSAPDLHTGYADVPTLLTAGFTRYWDEASQVPYAYNATTRQFISYEDPESLQRKCAFVREKQLGGIMFWQYLSDPSGALLNSIHRSLYVTAPLAEAHP